MYGWRARLGRITPSSSTAEHEWAMALPPGVISVTARIYMNRLETGQLNRMMEEVERAAREVASARVDVIAQCGTSAGAIQGFGFDRTLISKLQELTGVPCTTMVTAVIEALKRLEARRLVVGTAYTDDLNNALVNILTESGFEVLHIRGLGYADNHKVTDQFPEVSYRLGRAVAKEAPSADALFLSCGGLRTFEAIAPLEEDLEMPVVTSNQATMWHSLRLAGVKSRVEGYGRILEL